MPGPYPRQTTAFRFARSLYALPVTQGCSAELRAASLSAFHRHLLLALNEPAGGKEREGEKERHSFSLSRRSRKVGLSAAPNGTLSVRDPPSLVRYDKCVFGP